MKYVWTVSLSQVCLDIRQPLVKFAPQRIDVHALTGLTVEDLRNFSEEQTVLEQRKIADTVLGGLRAVRPMGSLLHKAFFVGRE